MATSDADHGARQEPTSDARPVVTHAPASAGASLSAALATALGGGKRYAGIAERPRRALPQASPTSAATIGGNATAVKRVTCSSRPLLERGEQRSRGARERGLASRRGGAHRGELDGGIVNDPGGAPREDDRALGEERRLEDRVGHEEHRQACSCQTREEPLVEALPRELVERGEGLVHEEELRARDERARDATRACACRRRARPG